MLGRARRTQQKSETRSRAGTSVPLQPCRHPMTDGARSAYSQGIPRAAAGESGPRFDGGGREAQLRADSSSLFFSGWLFGVCLALGLGSSHGSVPCPARPPGMKESCQHQSHFLIPPSLSLTSHASSLLRRLPVPFGLPPALHPRARCFETPGCISTVSMRRTHAYGKQCSRRGVRRGSQWMASSDGDRGPPRPRREERARPVADSARDGGAPGVEQADGGRLSGVPVKVQKSAGPDRAARGSRTWPAWLVSSQVPCILARIRAPHRIRETESLRWRVTG